VPNKILITLVILLVPLTYLFVREVKNNDVDIQVPNRIRECPDSWIENRMPGVSDKPDEKRQYFIVDGERKEIEEYDLEWIKQNCDIKPQIVY